MRKVGMCALALSLLGQAAYAAEFHCPSGDILCLITAIHASNANSQENTIFLDAGEYRLVAVDNNVIDFPDGVGGFVTDGPNGLPSITGRLTIRGPEGIGSTLIRDESAPEFRFFHVESTGSLTLSWVHMTGGQVTERRSPRPFGGGAVRSHGTLSVNSTILYGNRARGEGGAVFSGPSSCTEGGSSGGGTLTIRHSTIRHNLAGADENAAGGGVCSRGSAVIEDTFIHSNEVRGDQGGGGILSSGELSLRRTTIARNRAEFGGGGIDARGTTWIEDSSIYENWVTHSSGIAGGIANNGAMTIVSSTVANNRNDSTNAAGIFNGGFGTLALRNVAVTGNVNVSILRGPGGIASAGEPVSLENTIVANNWKFSGIGHEPSDCGPPSFPGPQFTSYGNNVIGSLSGCDAVLQTTDLVGDPFLGPFLHDVRPGRAHLPLLPGSPAINRGNPAVCRPTDQVGRVRLGQCDIGAVEFRPISLAGANSLVTFVPLEETFRFVGSTSANRCPSSFTGVFLFTARLTNQSGHDLTHPVLQIAELSSGNLLQGAQGTLFDAGSLLSLSFNTTINWTEPLDGTLRPTEFVDVPFSVCLKEQAPFHFSVNVLEVSEPNE